MIDTRQACLALGIVLCILATDRICSAQSTPPPEAEKGWRHLSSRRGELPVPGRSTQQTSALIADLDRDGVNDFVLGFRQVGPALVWYRREKSGWNRTVIEPAYLTIEAGGAAHDIDGDGDLDLVFGADYQGNQVWWWENPSPEFRPDRAWERHVIKSSGPTQHHDQVFCDLLGNGRPQLVFWNQGGSRLLLAEVPPEPRRSGPWAIRTLHQTNATKDGPPYVEGLSVADIDADGKPDVLAGNGWIRAIMAGGPRFTAIGPHGGRIAAGHFEPGKLPQVVIAPGDGIGPLMLYRCQGDPATSGNWTGRRLLERPLVHGHSLQIGDLDGDGHLDILAAEMSHWTERSPKSDHPEATAWILHGDGRGGFRTSVLSRGIEFHEAMAADLDGDGDIDILDKPYHGDAPRVDVWLNLRK